MDDILLRRLFKAAAEYYYLVETGGCADRGNGTKYTPQEITDELISALVDIRINRPDIDDAGVSPGQSSDFQQFGITGRTGA